MTLVVLRRSDGTGVTFDCSVSETHSKKSVVTEFPVEQGVNVTDHVRAGAITLALDQIVGAEPLAEGQGQPDGADRVQATYLEILAMQDDVDVLSVITTLATYDSMVIESTSVPRDAARGLILSVSLGLRQIRTATSVELDLPTPKAPRGQSTKADGRASASTVDKPAVADSYLRQLAAGAARMLNSNAFQ